MIHVLYFLAIWVDNYFNNIKFLYRHYAINLVLAVIYIIIYASYSLNYGELYPGVNCKNLLSYVVFFLLFFLMAVQYYVGNLLYNMKQKRIAANGMSDQEDHYSEISLQLQ